MTKSKTLRPEEVMDYLRERALMLAYDPGTRTLEAEGDRAARVTVTTVPVCQSIQPIRKETAEPSRHDEWLTRTGGDI